MLRHYQFQTQTWDMGVFIQMIWNTTQGRIFFTRIADAPNHLGVHFTPILFLVVAGYYLFQSPYFLLLIQALALALGALPLYLLSKKILENKKTALVVTISYLLYPSLHWVNVYDFHAIPFLIPLLLGGFYFIEIKKWGTAIIFLILATLVKEDAILVVMITGLYLLIRPKAETPHSGWTRERKIGTGVAITALIYFLIVIKIIMPALGGGLLRFDRYADLGGSLPEIVKNIATNPKLLFETIIIPQKIRYLALIFIPVAFLPFLAPRALILLVPGLAENLLTSYSFQFSNFYQYDAVLIAGMFIATVMGLKTIQNRWPKKEKLAVIVLSIGTLGAFFTNSPINPVTVPKELFKQNADWQTLREIINNIPDNASLTAPTTVVPHVSHRDYIYMINKEPFKTDIVLIDAADSFGFENSEAFQKYVDDYAANEEYTVEVIDDRYIQFTKKSFSETKQ